MREGGSRGRRRVGGGREGMRERESEEGVGREEEGGRE